MPALSCPEKVLTTTANSSSKCVQESAGVSKAELLLFTVKVCLRVPCCSGCRKIPPSGELSSEQGNGISAVSNRKGAGAQTSLNFVGQQTTNYHTMHDIRQRQSLTPKS